MTGDISLHDDPRDESRAASREHGCTFARIITNPATASEAMAAGIPYRELAPGRWVFPSWLFEALEAAALRRRLAEESVWRTGSAPAARRWGTKSCARNFVKARSR